MPPKIQPIDIDPQVLREPPRSDSSKPVLKSRLKRLFDRQFPGVLRNSSAEKPSTGGEAQYSKDGAGNEFEPSSVCLAKMVQNFIEESNEKQSAAKCGRNRCNCFNGNNNDSSDDEFDVFDGFGEAAITGSYGDVSDSLKSHKRKDDLRTIVVENLSSLGYDSSICKSKWEKTSSFPAGEYEYIDVTVDGERLLIDVDFRSEFEIARSTGAYRAVLQSLPYIFVGKADRLGQIVTIVSEAARQSLKKKGMHIAPWRKAEYMRAKWLSPYTRAAAAADAPETAGPEANGEGDPGGESDGGELELIFGEEAAQADEATAAVPPAPAPSPASSEPGVGAQTWQPPAVRPKSIEKGAKMVTGLASLLKEKP
ncbi:hypothetical protein CRG98_033519 [Punica granatum]|uniref:DUF506 domain-containing protein n=1 Tax=Punica granatum TaxID=22663 RepID=A0A2I0IPY3_PUNGR|nr:hypothetical protein CRG98_033519 [Punica granatum]